MSKDMRTAFEEAAFLQYFLSTIRRTGDGGPFELVSQACKPKAEFIAKAENGDYLETTLNAAWWAWRAAMQNLAHQSVELCLSEARQQELIQVAENGAPAVAIRLAVRETLEALANGVPAPSAFAEQGC